ncbi:protein tyrosine phosphatase [Roseibium hamelinense]|uniref:protein-tyrosine-phosphatase n=1 Tax=Roseibium hamelinense TaxID=150831 RepID=A0A562SMH6_9HYPH|nr:low molecular weight protein-tyrosine-phosphatase [Roseibium hamelinense]MTI43413.1 low molecular weight phosphotyrosine protein phosphatase [Roseibium hamelinense]TWI81870.1 protein tyrosine phosphatase [Roseibium hamelinense]
MTCQRILFVCLGNICRSPLAQGIFEKRAQDIGQADAFSFDSAGTGAWHVGNPPDPRSIDIARVHGIDISSQRARQIVRSDLEDFDVILAMDSNNLANLNRMAPVGPVARIELLFQSPARDVPDPYYGGDGGFNTVFRMIRERSEEILR